jgi:hypothetical protein
MQIDWNVYSLVQRPVWQAIFFVLLTPIVLLILQPKTADRAWVFAACTFIAFLVVNAALIWFDDRPWRYFFSSIGVAIGYLFAIAIVMSGLLKVMKLKSSGESAMTFLVIIYQPFALLLVMLVKWIAVKWF